MLKTKRRFRMKVQVLIQNMLIQFILLHVGNKMLLWG